MSRKGIRSSFHGSIEEIPGISADNFENAAAKKCRAYFLSHHHADHVVGLYTKELIDTLEKTNATIYMSEPTSAIIDTEIGDDKRLMKYIEVLNLGSTLITLPRDEEQNLEEIYVTVTVIPAGHSFGSVMYLFRMTACTVLYTGDFRIQKSDVSKIGPFHNRNGNPIKIDAMYVDTTFLNHEYSSNYFYFPKRSESTAYALDCIARWLQQDELNRVALCPSGNYTCEFFFNQLHEKLGVKTYVNKEKWEFYSKVQYLVHGVTNEGDSKSHYCHHWRKNHQKCTPKYDSNYKYLTVRLSATTWDGFDVTDTDPASQSSDTLKVCFATHCSKEEVKYFIKYFSPNKVEGFPNRYDENL